MARSHLETINARFRSAANSGTLKPRGVFNNRDNQFIRDIKDFYKNLKKRVKAHSDKVDDYESPPDDSPDDQDQISDATADKDDQTIIRHSSIDPSHEDYQRQKAREYFNGLMSRDPSVSEPILKVARDVLQERPLPPPSQSTLNLDPIRMEKLRHLHLLNSVRHANEMVSPKRPAAAVQHPRPVPRPVVPKKVMPPANSRAAITSFSWQSKFLEMDSMPGGPSQIVIVPVHRAKGQPEQQHGGGQRK
ncbi:unnamed protein product [Colletotrichum noveboracense]|uniref:Uncharacterized protein n=1 Tax=Colletotrichum noveboracense TaxID=2664923 RepID=A0A9W4S372_9PEZI|nr:hypothetical protein COL940_013017 [Colletotrichum noveboracense]KAJ0273749.1 hypothetical protein CBS470a_012103 [Colletotrichum nupharicola]KAJ0301101.1 hypothetical protein Brms1b_012543 [Colletotrichum noveboracense]CAI0652278.1 unnamed protein product [Colletotrichum noveboracense]